MPTPLPFAQLESFFQSLPIPTPPVWAIEESHRRIVVLINHVLMQEPEAMVRLVRQKGRVILAQWRQFTFTVVITPAGLLDLCAPQATPDLTLVMTEESPLALAQTLMQGQKPPVRIEGDVQLAAEVNWLADHVRWDLEEDLSRIIGDVPAHWLCQAGRTIAQAAHDFVAKAKAAAAPGKGA